MVERLAAGVLLLALTPLLMVIALILLIEQGLPVMFSQARVGLGRKPFVLYKFRTMADGRLTRIGRTLRATGLDEQRGSRRRCGRASSPRRSPACIEATISSLTNDDGRRRARR